MFEKEVKAKAGQYYSKFKTAWKMRGMEKQDLEQELSMFTWKILKTKTFESEELKRNYVYKSWHNRVNWLLKRCKSLNTVDIDDKDNKETFDNLISTRSKLYNKDLNKALQFLEPNEKELIIDRYYNQLDFKSLSNKYNCCRYTLSKKINLIHKKIIDIYC